MSKRSRSSDTEPIPKFKLTRNTSLYLLIGAFLFVYLVAKIGFDISNSLFVNHKDRLNFVIYGQTPTFYSLGINEAGNYAIPFYPDLKTQIPGGYSYYRIGALGKIVELDKKPDLFKKTFSAITSTYVDYYFYKPGEEVFYGGKDDKNTVQKPQWQDFMYLRSNASFFDKLYFLMVMNRFQGNSVYDINFLPYKRLKEDTIFRNDNFLEKYIGSFYQKTYRNENLNVQILYSNHERYNTAETISNILNGNGIVVGDISQTDNKIRSCVVREGAEKGYSKTSRSIAQFFGCKLEKGDTDVYDILVELGDLQDTWEVD
jgi:hypothetical protein